MLQQILFVIYNLLWIWSRNSNMREGLSTLAIIVPCYNEEEVLEMSNNVFLSILEKMKNLSLISQDSYICYVNDGSKDRTWSIIESFVQKEKYVQGITFSRNFGHQSAMLAGITTCHADVFITIDADLQEEPEAMIEMIKKYNEGYEVVYGVRSERDDKFMKKYLSNAFYKLMKMLGSDTIPNASEYRLISKRVVEEIKKYNEKNIYLRGIIASIGFSYTVVYYKRVARIAGETKYPISKLITTALNGITTTSIKPLNWIVFLGIIAFIISMLLLVMTVVCFIINHNTVYYWLISFVISFFGLLQLISIGIIGEYIAKIFKNTQDRPLFIIDEYKCNTDNKKI